MLGSDGVSPAFNCRTVDLDSCAALAADQMMVVRAAALSVDRFTVLSDDDIHLSCISHRAEGSVHRRETDALAVDSQVLVQFLA